MDLMQVVTNGCQRYTKFAEVLGWVGLGAHYLGDLVEIYWEISTLVDIRNRLDRIVELPENGFW